MTFNRAFRPGLSVTIAAAALSLGGCAMFGHTPPVEEPTVAPVETGSAAPEHQLTATEAAIQANAAGGDATVSAAPAPTADMIKPTAPTEYTVKRGDTLWGISNVFLKNPWQWPEIWYVNPKIANPHLIYPGDVLVLAYGRDGRPQISIEHESALRLNPALRSTPLDDAIPTIPYSAIAAFLSRPALLSKDEVSKAPYVLGFPDEHQAAGDDQIVYMRGLADAATGARYSVIHVGDPIRDPDSGRTLGYMGIYASTAVVQRPAKVARTVLVDAARETLRGDCLMPDSGTTPLNFTPRAPAQPVKGKIIAIVDSETLIGQYNIVAINRGSHDGVAPGTVLAIDQAGDVVNDRGPASYADASSDGRGLFGLGKTVQLPAERAGTLLVFKSYDDMSYGLVVGSSTPMRIADVVRNP
jgi:LysM repeat protein